jgi:hypothetical protein
VLSQIEIGSGSETVKNDRFFLRIQIQLGTIAYSPGLLSMQIFTLRTESGQLLKRKTMTPLFQAQEMVINQVLSKKFLIWITEFEPNASADITARRPFPETTWNKKISSMPYI